MKSIYKGGSSIILNKSNDVDYIVYCDDKVECCGAFAINHDREHDRHFVLWEKRLNIFLGCYAYPFMEHIEGEEIKEFKTFNICDYKKEYCEVALRYAERMKLGDKRWYHILCAYYMFENGKNKITKEQKAEVQKAHDNGVDETLKEKLLTYLQTNRN